LRNRGFGCVLLFAALVPAGAHADDAPEHFSPRVWISPGIYSQHFDRSKHLQNDNPGPGVEVALARDHVLLGGSYINSNRARTRYGAYAWRPLHWRIAGLGVSEAVRGFSPLPGVAQELEQLVLRGAKDRDGVAEGILRLNRDFTSKAFLGVLDEGYPVIHIASHFVFTPGTEKDSYLLLGDGGRITLADIRSHYDFNAVDLLTLSACNTAVGGSANGREIEGFGALAQNRGAKGVLATLWAVSDASTGRFMVQLYRNRATLSKAEALQQAQQSMLREGKFRHPYFWAPFVLLGNWL